MNLLQDFRFALRSLRSRAGTATFATLTLATGMAAAIAISCVIDAVLVRALPYPGAERLVQINEVAADGHDMALAEPNYDDLVASVDAISASAFHSAWPGTIQSGDNTIRATLDTTGGGDFFGVLGIAPQLGRTYGKDERDKVAVVSDALWQGLLGARADVIGSRIDINGDRYTIVAVMPRGFAFPAGAATWTPSLDPPYTSRTAHNWDAIGRLGAQSDLGRARVAANALAARLKSRFGDGVDAVSFDITPLGDAIAAPARNALLVLGAGIAFLLLIAIINTTNLLLALNGARARELAVRAALGASGARLARQILIESLIVALAA
ncbi:MAG TPA: ABC transporter permease, partial [Rhodanobacteraceae bacterium]